MSLGIAITTTGGMVLAADSRQSYTNLKGVSRIGSDSAQKIFNINDRIGVVVAGRAFIDDDGTPKNVSRYIEEFNRTHETERKTVRQIADELHAFFNEKQHIAEMIEDMKKQISSDLERQGLKMGNVKQEGAQVKFRIKTPDGKDNRTGVAMIQGVNLLVAGFNLDGSHMVCNVTCPGDVRVTRDSTAKNREYGADWIGQTDVVSRVVKGFDGRIAGLPFMQKAGQEVTHEQVQQQLNGLEYVIQWGAMTMQDAVDFSRLVIETTTSIQRFSDGIAMDPGDTPGVGGAVDMAYLTRDSKFEWLSNKTLSAARRDIV